ncbi:hypothetical protein T265_07742 [Opisthorchis viverrini]|uniref:Uncharacterized protein n=1 Tax=Opisthorchis viverrini TaxID=6198 RepID=A0A074ZMU0_OPIVI|nr:hypothetical protein T265_07742 [Opisthorchis viverrini]KER24645.1 hypothetical protein T265_07742 [Opisthorchis viverrini]
MMKGNKQENLLQSEFSLAVGVQALSSVASVGGEFRGFVYHGAFVGVDETEDGRSMIVAKPEEDPRKFTEESPVSSSQMAGALKSPTIGYFE